MAALLCPAGVRADVTEAADEPLPPALMEGAAEEDLLEPVQLSTAAVEPEPAPSADAPKWLRNAEKTYAEALKDLEKGDNKRAGKKMRAVLKSLYKHADGPALFEAKEDMESLLASMEEHFSMPPTRSEGLDVSPQELAVTTPTDTPSSVEEKKYSMPINPDDPLVQKYIAIYTGQYRHRMQDALNRMQIYKPMIERELRAAKLPRELLYLPITESEYINTAHSRAGAVGLWQFMPTTGRGMGLTVNYWLDERRDPEKATKAAIAYLKYLHEWFTDWHLALAAYNLGEYGMERKMAFTKSLDFSTLSVNRALPRETESYVPKFMACVIIADNPESFGFSVVKPQIMDFEEVVLEKPLDLKIAAESAGTTESVIRELNPTVRLWCTPKDMPSFKLKIPAGTKEKFFTALASVKDWTPSTGFVQYKVRKGDFIGAIARKYRTTSKTILQDNKIRDPRRLRPGQVLVIRPGRGFRGE